MKLVYVDHPTRGNKKHITERKKAIYTFFNSIKSGDILALKNMQASEIATGKQATAKKYETDFPTLYSQTDPGKLNDFKIMYAEQSTVVLLTDPVTIEEDTNPTKGKLPRIWMASASFRGMIDGCMHNMILDCNISMGQYMVVDDVDQTNDDWSIAKIEL